MTTSDTRKKQFINDTFQVLSSTLHASCFAFYSVDSDHNLYDFIRARVPDDLYRLYIQEMYQIDPLHVRRVASDWQAVVRMDQASTYMPSSELVEYTRFMRRYGIVNNIDLLFRHDGEIKAGLSIMWTSQDRRPTTKDYKLAGDLQPYIQSNLSTHLLPSHADKSLCALHAFHLTPRETEIAKLIAVGRTNADIAISLGIGVATVKTHLLHLFEKTGVKCRSGLVARLFDLS